MSGKKWVPNPNPKPSRSTDLGHSKSNTKKCNTGGCNNRISDSDRYCYDCRRAIRSRVTGEDKKLTERSKKEIAKRMKERKL